MTSKAKQCSLKVQLEYPEKTYPPENYQFTDSKKKSVGTIEYLSTDDEKAALEQERKRPTEYKDIIAEVISTEDDPSQNPWTFRMWFIGIMMSIFGVFDGAQIVTTLNMFRPQSFFLQLVFVSVFVYVIGKAMERLIPRRGRLGQLLNPGPFNKKEHSAIVIMTAAGASSPEATMTLAVQKLCYNTTSKPGVAIFLIMSTQLLGYGVAGILRETLVYPSQMLYPTNIPTASLLEHLHKAEYFSKKKIRVFNICFLILFCWQAFPQYIMPLLSGISIFCLAMRDDLVVTNLFGGSMANEGLGLFSLSFDWSAVSAQANPLWLPFPTLVNFLVSWLVAISLFMGMYYSNVLEAKKYPFLASSLFSQNSTNQQYIVYNHTAILNSNFQIDPKLLAEHGLPSLAVSNVIGKTCLNIGITAAVSHMMIWHGKDLKSALVVFEPLKLIFKPKEWNLKFWTYHTVRPSPDEAQAIDPHYRVMLNYEEVPKWWYALLWILATVIGFLTSRLSGSGLGFWVYVAAIFLGATLAVFFAALNAMFGTTVNAQPLLQMLGAYIIPGRPIANLYFTTFGYNSLYQTKNMLSDLKLGQYVHLPPKCTFVCQIIGTCIGCMMSYLTMEQITTQKRDVLLSIQGSNVWSGQAVQFHNVSAVTWGGLARELYSIGGKYQMLGLGFVIGIFAPVPFWLGHRFFPKLGLNYWNMAVITSHVNNACYGSHSGLMVNFLAGFASQFWLRKYHTNWFVKYNYIISAGIDGGAQVMGCILMFSVFGGAGRVIRFPKYFGNNFHQGNFDYCKRDPALGSRQS